MTDIAIAPARAGGFFSALAPRGKAVFFALTAVAVCLLFAFPVFWLVLTSLRPGTGVYYVHRGTEFTIDNFNDHKDFNYYLYNKDPQKYQNHHLHNSIANTNHLD